MKRFFQIQPNKILKRFYPKAIWEMPTNEKVIYLTFDDGPIPGLTEWILDELEKYGAKATFFCVGENIHKYPDIFKKIKVRGHLAANHSFQHIKGFHSETMEYIENVELCEKLTGNKLFRPPYGQLRKKQYRELLSRGYKIVMWDVISYDYEKITPENCLKNILKNTKRGSIILFHDNIKAEENVKYALSHTLKHFHAEGFRFCSIPE